MNIVERAKQFAILAHKGQVRKSEPDKPMVIHPIHVANLLEEYGFDENVVAAGYLHDVVEDTRYTDEDIRTIFGIDIESLVMGASEPDKSLSWEERKLHTIETVKDLDLRHKAIVCADKISNLGDLINLFGKTGEFNFRAFKRGFDSQKWYYTEVYKSLINNEDPQFPMFVQLKKMIDYLFYGVREDTFVREIIFENYNQEYSSLLKLHYKKQELIKLKSIISDIAPYVIEFTGTPRTGKTTLISNLYDFFKKGGFEVEVLEEFTTSKKYKTEVYPLLKDQYKNVVNTEIPKYVLAQLDEVLERRPDIIMIDRSLFDRLIWVDRLYLKGGMTEREYQDYKKLYIPLILEKINIIISTYTDSLTSLRRDYCANLSLEERRFLNVSNVDEYNLSLNNMKDLATQVEFPFYQFDTTNKNQREVSMEVTDVILNDIRFKYVKRLQKEF